MGDLLLCGRKVKDMVALSQFARNNSVDSGEDSERYSEEEYNSGNSINVLPLRVQLRPAHRYHTTVMILGEQGTSHEQEWYSREAGNQPHTSNDADGASFGTAVEGEQR